MPAFPWGSYRRCRTFVLFVHTLVVSMDEQSKAAAIGEYSVMKHHGASVHISSCVILERGGSNVRCSVDEGRIVVTH